MYQTFLYRFPGLGPHDCEEKYEYGTSEIIA